MSLREIEAVSLTPLRTQSPLTRLANVLVILLVAISFVGCAPRADKDKVVLWTAFEGVEMDTLRQRIEA